MQASGDFWPYEVRTPGAATSPNIRCMIFPSAWALALLPTLDLQEMWVRTYRFVHKVEGLISLRLTSCVIQRQKRSTSPFMRDSISWSCRWTNLHRRDVLHVMRYGTGSGHC